MTLRHGVLIGLITVLVGVACIVVGSPVVGAVLVLIGTAWGAVALIARDGR